MDEPGFSLRDSNICIVGLGLMGGSMALALRDQVAGITAVDADPATCDAAVQQGIVSQASSDLNLAASAEIVILATPVRTLIQQISELAPILKPGTLIFDLGSVKGPVVEAMNALPAHIHAVAGHPMCGKEVSGVAHADAALYQGARFVLCRTERTTTEAWALASAIVDTIGAHSVEMDSAHHDQVAALISHLPYLMSAALASEAGRAASTDPMLWTLASSGFRDTSRLAGSDPTMMSNILSLNSVNVMAAMAGAQAVLQQLSEALLHEDYEQICGTLSVAQNARRSWEESQRK
jgi:prephenate dehydrogenase